MIFPAPAAATVPVDELIRTLRHHAAGVVVVTMTDSGGRPVGFTASSFLCVSVEPPIVLFTVRAGSQSAQAVQDTGSYVVNFLGAAHKSLASRFAGPAADRFGPDTSWYPLDDRVPVLRDVPRWMRVERRALIDAGDHHVVLSDVQEVRHLTDDGPLVHHDRAYHRLDHQTKIPDPTADAARAAAPTPFQSRR